MSVEGYTRKVVDAAKLGGIPMEREYAVVRAFTGAYFCAPYVSFYLDRCYFDEAVSSRAQSRPITTVTRYVDNEYLGDPSKRAGPEIQHTNTENL